MPPPSGARAVEQVFPSDIGAIKVSRRWLPWKSRTRKAASTAWDWVPDWGRSYVSDDPVSSTLAAIGWIIALPFMIPALLVTPFFLLECLLQWLCFPFALVLRFAGIIPVAIETTRRGEILHTERVTGWGKARARRDEFRAWNAAQAAAAKAQLPGRS